MREERTSTFKLDPPRTDIYNLSLTFDARGEVVSAVKKVNLVKGLEDTLELSPGELVEQQPFEVSGVRVGNLICYDGFLTGHEPAFVPVGPKLVGQGAEILTQPSANTQGWGEPWALRSQGESITQADAWFQHGLLALMEQLPEVRYGINPMLNGRFFDLSFEGQSTILGRDAEGRPSILARASSYGDDAGAEEVLKVVASLPARSRLRPPLSGLQPLVGEGSSPRPSVPNRA